MADCYSVVTEDQEILRCSIGASLSSLLLGGPTCASRTIAELVQDFFSVQNWGTFACDCDVAVKDLAIEVIFVIIPMNCCELHISQRGQ